MAQRYTSPQPFEELEHTADLGLRVRGRSAEEALARLVLAFAQVRTGGGDVVEGDEITVAAEPGERVLMAIDVLRELLYTCDDKELVAHSCEVDCFDPARGARVRVGVGPYDPEAHAEGSDIKAVTLHAARFEPEPKDGWVAQVVLDV